MSILYTMRKILVIVAIVWACTLPAVAVQNQDPANKHASERQVPASPILTVTNNESTAYFRQHAEARPQGWHELLAWPEGITTWAIILTLLAITWQAVLIRKSIAMIGRQIKVAEADTQAMIQAERAWIVISVDEFPAGVYRFWAENKGKTPARTLSFWGESIYLERGSEYVERPDETTRSALLQFPPCLMPPGDKRIVWECQRSAIEAASGGGNGDESRFSRGFGSGYIYGRIRYLDVLDAKPQEPHETRWLYWLIPQPKSIPFQHPLHPERNTYS